MGNTELHIHLDLDEVIRTAEKAAANLPEKVEVEVERVPRGYRCVECYQDDGGHARSCQIGQGGPT